MHAGEPGASAPPGVQKGRPAVTTDGNKTLSANVVLGDVTVKRLDLFMSLS